MERPALEAAASEWLVYGDSLQQAGDPRGELVSLAHAIDEGRSDESVRDGYVREHGVRLLGPAKQHLDAYTLEWRYSEAVAATVTIKPGDDAVGLVRSLLEAPVAECLSQLSLVAHADPGAPIDLAPVIALIEATPRIRGLGLVDARAAKARMLVSRDFEPDANLVQLGSLAGLWPQLERIRLVVANAQELALGKIDAPELRSFVLHDLYYADGWSDGGGEISGLLAAASWPKLADFELDLTEAWLANVPDEQDPYVPVYSAADYDGRDDVDDGDVETLDWGGEIGALLANLAKRPLRRLVLRSFVSGHTLLEAIATAGLAPTLVELDFSHSELADGHLGPLLENPLPFKHLKRLVLDGTHVTDDGLGRLRALGFEVVKDPATTAGAAHRFLVGQE